MYDSFFFSFLWIPEKPISKEIVHIRNIRWQQRINLIFMQWINVKYKIESNFQVKHYRKMRPFQLERAVYYYLLLSVLIVRSVPIRIRSLKRNVYYSVLHRIAHWIDGQGAFCYESNVYVLTRCNNKFYPRKINWKKKNRWLYYYRFAFSLLNVWRARINEMKQRSEN